MDHRTIQEWRKAEGFIEHGGAVLAYGDEVQGWVNDLSYAPRSWKPGTQAFMEDGTCFIAKGGTDYDGALYWELFEQQAMENDTMGTQLVTTVDQVIHFAANQGKAAVFAPLSEQLGISVDEVAGLANVGSARCDLASKVWRTCNDLPGFAEAFSAWVFSNPEKWALVPPSLNCRIVNQLGLHDLPKTQCAGQDYSIGTTITGHPVLVEAMVDISGSLYAGLLQGEQA